MGLNVPVGRRTLKNENADLRQVGRLLSSCSEDMNLGGRSCRKGVKNLVLFHRGH